MRSVGIGIGVGVGVGVRVRDFGLAALAVAVISIAAVPDPGASASAPPTPMAVPLVSGVTTSALSSVALPMGNLTQSENKFWEVFLQSAPGSAWTLRTPPGVASNGGLVVAVGPEGLVTVGFLPSQLLHFSPVAQSGDEGTGWSPGFLPESLVAAPDALVSVPTAASATTTDAVVTAGSGQRVLTGQGVGGWRTLVTRAALARTVPGCTVLRITAVALVIGTTGTAGVADPALGVQCAQQGRIGVLIPSTGDAGAGSGSPSWSSVGPRLAGFDRATATVLRLESSAAGLAGLAGVRTGRVTALVAFWRSAATAVWSQSAPLRVPSGWTVRASAGGGSSGQGEAVLLGSGASLRVVEIAGPARNWKTLSAPPLGTEALVFRGDLTDAFSVSGSKLRVWTSSVGAAAWQRTQATTVPVPYGSSG